MKRTYAALLCACALTLVISSSAQADQIVKPHTFSAGSPALAEEVNANFDALYDQSNKVGSEINVDEANGRVGIGTAAPGEKLEVGGTISSTSGGFKFPDGTVQTTATANHIRVVYLKDVKPSGTYGGTCTSGIWQQRTLNTVEGDAGLVSLAANRFTLQPGSYEIEASAPAFMTNQHKVALYNVSSGAFSLLGSVGHSNSSYPSLTFSTIQGHLTLNEPTVFELQHRCYNSSITVGFGYASSFGVDEVYSQVKITKVE